MDVDKLKQWMELSQKYQNGNFWDMIFDQSPSDQVKKETENESPPPTKETPRGILPLVDIYLTDTHVLVLVELPGLRKEDVHLSLSGNKLAVKGISKLPIVNGVTIRNERNYGEFDRLIELPEPAESKDIHAKFDCGLLIVTYMRRYPQQESIPIL